MDQAELDRRFDYHKPDLERLVNHNRVRMSMKLLATVFDTCLPEGREKSLAMTKIEEAMFWANAAIARN